MTPAQTAAVLLGSGLVLVSAALAAGVRAAEHAASKWADVSHLPLPDEADE